MDQHIGQTDKQTDRQAAGWTSFWFLFPEAQWILPFLFFSIPFFFWLSFTVFALSSLVPLLFYPSLYFILFPLPIVGLRMNGYISLVGHSLVVSRPPLLATHTCLASLRFRRLFLLSLFLAVCLRLFFSSFFSLR